MVTVAVLKSAFDSYKSVQEAVQSQLSGVRAATIAPLESMRRFFTPPAAPSSKLEELDQLRERVAELEQQLKTTPQPQRRRKKTKRKT